MDRVDELNMRINERNSTNTLLEPVLIQDLLEQEVV